MSAEWLLSTIRSWSPLATRTGWVMIDRSSGWLCPACRIALSCARRACDGDRLVAVLGAFLEAAEVVRRGASCLRGCGGRTGSSVGSLQRESGFDVGAADDGGHLLDAAAAAGSGAGEDHAADQVWCLQGDHLGDAAAE